MQSTLDLDSRVGLDLETRAAFRRDGYVRLGRLDPATLEGLQRAINDVMQGRASIPYERVLMQLDSSTGDYADLGPQTKGFKGRTLDYRKIQDLELEPRFLAYLKAPRFERIARDFYARSAVACFRAMFMNKPAAGGTVLNWHQDRWTSLDRDPEFTIWTALDDATTENGCLEVIPGSHGVLVNPSDPSAHLTPEQRAEWDRVPKKALPVEAGTVLLLHNWLLHRSGINHSNEPRRAFSVCYMDAETVDAKGRRYTPLFDALD